MSANDLNPEPTALHIYLCDQGKFLSTRAAGKKAAAAFKRITEDPGDVILDFKDVEAATPPFLQEVLDAVTALIGANEDTGRIVVAAHLNEDLAETMRYVGARAKRTFSYLDGNKLTLLQERPKLIQTLQEAQELNRFFTAPQLAERLNINKDTATQRLKKLIRLGAAERRVDPDAANRHLYRVAKPDLAKRQIAERPRPRSAH